MYSLFFYDSLGRGDKVNQTLNLERCLSYLASYAENGTNATYAKIFNTNGATKTNPLGEVLKHNFK